MPAPVASVGGVPTARGTEVSTLFRRTSIVFFIIAIGAMLTLLVSDLFNALAPTVVHRCAGALSFLFIGLSYLALQISLRRPFSEKAKAILLGLAFFMWGTGQFIAPGLLATALDSAVVVIFVVDLSLIIIEHLKRNQYD